MQRVIHFFRVPYRECDFLLCYLRIAEELVLSIVALVDARQLRVVVQIAHEAPRVHTPLARLHIVVGQQVALALQHLHNVGRSQHAPWLGVSLPRSGGFEINARVGLVWCNSFLFDASREVDESLDFHTAYNTKDNRECDELAREGGEQIYRLPTFVGIIIPTAGSCRLRWVFALTESSPWLPSSIRVVMWTKNSPAEIIKQQQHHHQPFLGRPIKFSSLCRFCPYDEGNSFRFRLRFRS